MFGGFRGETLPYEIISRRDGYEIRRFHKLYLIRIRLQIDKDNELSFESDEGFDRLFKYIRGDNDKRQKLRMTIPYIIQQTEIDSNIQRTISFLLSPSKFTSLNQIPVANDRTIEIIEQIPSFDMACITFYRSMTKQTIKDKEKQLRKLTKRDQIHLSSYQNNILYLGYNPPATISYFQKNELCIPIINY